MDAGQEQAAGSEQGPQRTEGERRQLLLHLSEMVKTRGVEGAAQELSVSARTLRRVRASASLTPAVEEAVARHVAQTVASGDAPWWQRTEELEQRLGRLEQTVREKGERLTELEEASQRREQETGGSLHTAVQRLEKLERKVEELAGAFSNQSVGIRADASSHRADGHHVEAGQVRRVDQGQAAALSPDIQRLVDERNAAKADEEQAAGDMERLAALERRLDAELHLIRNHGQTWPLGHTWTGSKQAEEIAWRLDAMDANRQERDRLKRRRRLRRVLTLGLWW